MSKGSKSFGFFFVPKLCRQAGLGIVSAALLPETDQSINQSIVHPPRFYISRRRHGNFGFSDRSPPQSNRSFVRHTSKTSFLFRQKGKSIATVLSQPGKLHTAKNQSYTNFANHAYPLFTLGSKSTPGAGKTSKRCRAPSRTATSASTPFAFSAATVRTLCCHGIKSSSFPWIRKVGVR